MNVAGGCLVVAFKESSNDQAAMEFQNEVFEESIRRETKGIIFDLSGVSLMDSLMSQSLADICRGTLILGKKSVVVGLKPSVVASLVDLEVDLSCISAATNIEEAIALINPPAAEAEPLKAKEIISDEDAEHEEDGEDEVSKTEEDASE